jgi:hypothetical protein
MAIKITLNDGTELVVAAKLDQWETAFRRAAAANAMLEIRLPDGSIRPIDPRSIESFREDAEAAEELERGFRPEAVTA